MVLQRRDVSKDGPLIDTPHLPLALTGREVVFLCDRIANKDYAEGLEDKERYIPLARKALLLLGSAYVEVVKPDKIEYDARVTLHVDEEIAWLLRGKVTTGDLGIDGKPIGPTLLVKIYAILLEFAAGLSDLEITIEDWPTWNDIPTDNKSILETTYGRNEPQQSSPTGEGPDASRAGNDTGDAPTSDGTGQNLSSAAPENDTYD